MIKTNLKFTQQLKDMWEDGGEDENEVSPAEMKSKGETALVFDASAFKASAKSYGGLSVKARKCLSKHPTERNEDELVLLRVRMQRRHFYLY